MLGDFSAKVGGEDIFKLAIGNLNLHKINDNGVRIVKYTTSKNLIFRNSFQHYSIHKHTSDFS
jgi:hypothetical protein